MIFFPRRKLKNLLRNEDLSYIMEYTKIGSSVANSENILNAYELKCEIHGGLVGFEKLKKKIEIKGFYRVRAFYFYDGKNPWTVFTDVNIKEILGILRPK